MRPMVQLSAETLRTLLERVLRTNQVFGQCLECETALEDMHPTSCRTSAAILEARFALVRAGLTKGEAA